MIKFQYYTGGVYKSKPLGFVSVEQFVLTHTNLSDKLKLIFERIASAKNKKEKSKLKEQLPFYTPSAIFKELRRYSNLIEFTGLTQLDFDNVERSVALKDYLFKTYPQITCSYLSPSRKGVKALIRIPISKNLNEFREYYAGLIQEFEGIDGFDSSPKNAALPLFLSDDKDILYRNNPTVWSRKGKVKKDIDFTNLNDDILKTQQFKDEGYGSAGYYERITKEIFIKKINNITGEPGHPRLLSACLILGSRVGAGYVNYNDALALAEWEIKSNAYLQKGLAGYLKTAKWALDNGYANPKFYS